MTPSDSCRADSMKPQVLIDDDIGTIGIGHECVAILGQLAEHALAIHGGLGTAEGDEGKRTFTGGGHSQQIVNWGHKQELYASGAASAAL